MHAITLPIITERLRLRLFTEGDFAAYAAYHCQPEVYRYLYAPVPSESELEKNLDDAINGRLENKGDILFCAVTLRDTDELIGEALLKLINPDALQAEIGYIFNPAYSGKGYATEAVGALLARGFTEGGFHRICARLDADNDGSVGIVKRLGLRQEAHFRQNDSYDGRFGDELVYAMLKEEFLAKAETR